jgi:Tfp pilus assembly major pilin PilA
MKKAEKILKINATIEDDLNLIVDTIQKSDANMILLVLPEGNDVLNSPVGLKTLKRKVLGLHKAVVLVVPSVLYADIARESGFIVTTSIDEVTPELWNRVVSGVEDFKNTQVGLNSAQNRKGPKKVSATEKEPDEKVETEEENDVDLDYKVGAIKATTVEKERKEQSDKLIRGAVIGTDFSKVVSKSSPSFLDSFLGMFRSKQKVPTESLDSPYTSSDSKSKSPQKGRALKIFGTFVGGLLFIGSLFFAIYYMYVPTLRIELKVVSDKLVQDQTVTATTAITGFDISKKEIQLVKEKAEQNGSVSITATGTGVEGKKATGSVVLSRNGSGTGQIPIPAGSTVKSSNNLSFLTQAEVQLGSEPKSVNVVAAEFGEEYNLPPSSGFTVEGVSGVNGISMSAFTGGTKREFKVLSKKDVDDAVDQLKKDLFAQIKSELEFRNQSNSYVFIPQSFKSQVEGNPNVSPTVGTETTDASLELKTSGTALYYHKESLEKLIENLVAEAYRKEKSVEPSLELQISDLKYEIKEISIDDNDKVTLKVNISALVTPKINTEQLQKDIAGKQWSEMLTKVSSINTLAATPNITFFPQWMPDFLRYVPKEENRIDISIRVEQPQ